MRSVLGPEEKRVKTDLRLPKDLLLQVDRMCAALGVPKNAFFVMSASILLIQLSPMLGKKKSAFLLRKIEELFQKVVKNVRILA